MSDATSSADSFEEFLARLMQELEGASDREAVIDRACEENPGWADEIRTLAGMNQAMAEGEGAEPAVPARLGEFRILRRLSRGGMGEIYEAEQESLKKRKVAVKVIRRGRVSPQARERFLREQEVLARLHQTHIVPIHTAGEEGRLQYFVMPFIDGAALHHVIHAVRQEKTAQPDSKTPTIAELAGRVAGVAAEKAGALTTDYRPSDPPQAGSEKREATADDSSSHPTRLSTEYFRSVAAVMADAAEAVQHAHDARVLHRDLKPSNVMVDRTGQCWIIDFGLAAFTSVPTTEPYCSAGPDGSAPNPITVSGVMGTPHYMAPEQFAGRADARSDVWGLGATLYELLTLRRAFDGPTEGEVKARILSRELPSSPAELVHNVPPDLAAICLKALHKEPAQRYSTTRAFAEDLRRWLRQEPTQARPAWLFRRTCLWMRRNKGWAAALVLGGLACLACLVATVWKLDRSLSGILHFNPYLANGCVKID